MIYNQLGDMFYNTSYTLRFVKYNEGCVTCVTLCIT